MGRDDCGIISIERSISSFASLAMPSLSAREVDSERMQAIKEPHGYFSKTAHPAGSHRRHRSQGAADGGIHTHRRKKARRCRSTRAIAKIRQMVAEELQAVAARTRCDHE